MRPVLRALLLAAVVLALSVQTALGGRPIHDKFVEDATFPEDLCAVPVTTHVQINGTVLIFEDRIVDLSPVRMTWTNEEGDWLQLFIAGERRHPDADRPQ